MSDEWRIYDDPCECAFVLVHPSGARAFFAYSDFKDPLVGRYVGAARDPFRGLARAIAAGVRPFKVEGDLVELARKFNSLEAPALQLEAPK